MKKNYDLTDLQRKTAKKVEKAIKEAAKLGVEFFDDYGRLTAYNGLIIKLPVPDHTLAEELNPDFVYSMNLDNFHAGNADDQLYVERK